MRQPVATLALVLSLVAPHMAVAGGSRSTPASAPWDRFVSPLRPQPAGRMCCKTCSKGKACGDSCISRSNTCSRPPGCACDS